jgi:hypothetical protein
MCDPGAQTERRSVPALWSQDEDLQWLRCFMRKKKVAEKWSVKAGFVVYNDG